MEKVYQLWSAASRDNSFLRCLGI